MASERVLRSIKNSVPRQWAEKATELAAIATRVPTVTLGEFLSQSGLELDDVYAQNRSWSDLRASAGLSVLGAGPHEEALRRACGRLLHVDDRERLETWREWLSRGSAPDVGQLTVRERRLLRMLLAQVLVRAATSDMSLADGSDILWQHPQVCAELCELFDVLAGRVTHLARAVDPLADVPMLTPARYTRLEILAACDVSDGVRMRPWREGVLYIRDLNTDVFVFTLDKTNGQFSPTTRYRDYAISRELIHWESQSTTSASSPTGQRYQHHEAGGGTVLLFARLNSAERASYCLGTATYVSHSGELPMAVTWRLQQPLPGDLFQAFAAAVA